MQKEKKMQRKSRPLRVGLAARSVLPRPDEFVCADPITSELEEALWDRSDLDNQKVRARLLRVLLWIQAEDELDALNKQLRQGPPA